VIADGAGPIPSDLDAERALVDCLIVNPHDNRPLPGGRLFALRAASIGGAAVEKHLAKMASPQGARGLSRNAGKANPSSRTIRAVQLDKQSGPHGPDRHPEPGVGSTSVSAKAALYRAIITAIPLHFAAKRPEARRKPVPAPKKQRSAQRQ
jgi:hypothetical protein